jgi:hypothetical protein
MMRRSSLLIGLVLVLIACAAPTVTSSEPALFPTTTVVQSPAATLSFTLTATTTATATAPATLTFTPSPTAVPPTATPTAVPPTATSTAVPPTATPTAVPPTTTPTPLAGDLWLGPADFRIHPDGETYYSGDLVSFQVFAHHGYDWATGTPPDVDVEIWLGVPGEGEVIAEERVAFYGGLDGEAWLEWVWDTTGLVGPQALTAVLDPDDQIQIGDEDPDNNLVARTIDLRPPEELPAVWADARWTQAENECCFFHYISRGAAERDIETLMAVADEAFAYAGQRLGLETDQTKLDVFLIDRVLGHGGFAAGHVIISYLDRFYAGGALSQVLRHEAVHVLDRRITEVRPTLLSEGLAVYISDGHFREEPITKRAAALLALNRYIPLAELAEDFYPSQHEIGYLEGAGLVEYLVDRFGWEAFLTFYGGMKANDEGQAAMIDVALQEHFDLTLGEVEAEWLAMLEALPPPRTQMTDLRLTTEFYDTLRRYQREFDPSAYFLEVWLPHIEEAEQRQITADWLRHPSDLINVTLETMFVAADSALDKARYAEMEALLNAINGVLDAEGDVMADPLAQQYGALVQAAAAAGYEAQSIDLDLERNTARVLAAKQHEADTVELSFTLVADVWRVTSWGN